ncbi:asparaginase [Pseudolysinimonas sp.]|uniref:asparaginase n=1 Tax=Pseudolysinimonas sp. TaxID=2680009 RepID=UPI003F803741
MTRIVLLATGGTIASRTSAPGSGAVARDGAGVLRAGLGHRAAGVDLETVDVLRGNSFAFGPAEQRAVADAVRAQLARPEVDGVVVAHGTDTLEESAFLVDLAHGDPRPVVFTGAQRAADLPDADGPANLADAVAVAASPAARGRGVLVAFGGSVFAARGVRKAHTLALQPFADPDAGAIGAVRGDAVAFWARPDRVLLDPVDARFDDVRVEVVAAWPGADAAPLRAVLDRAAHGVVLVAFGAGNPTPGLTSAIGELTAAGVLVALGTRVAAGPVAAIYGGGGAVDAGAAGAVPLGRLGVAQGRLAAAVLLAQHPVEEAARRLAALASGEPAAP